MFDLSQYSDIALLILRIALATTFLYHGMKKLKLWKAGAGSGMKKQMVWLMRFLSVAETLGAVAIITGFLAQIAAIGLLPIMFGAIYFKVYVWGKEFSEEGGGWETDMLIIAMLVAVIILGTGSLYL